MTILQIVREYLEGHGFDGLVNPGLDCGCGSDDLAPCDSLGDDCVAGYRWICPENVQDCPEVGEEGAPCALYPTGCFFTFASHRLESQP